MTYNPATDYVALWRAVTGGVAKEEMPGLDFVVAALGRSGALNISVSNIAPVASQAVTPWFQPAATSYSGEGALKLWNGAAYVAASQSLLLETLASAELAATSNVAITKLLDTLGSARADIAFRGAAAWQALAPGAANTVLMSNGAAADPSWSAFVPSLNGLTGAVSVVAGTGILTVTPAGASVTINASAKHMPGTATNDNAAAGEIGEYAETTVLTAAQVALTSGVAADVATISLTAGDWDVWGLVAFNPAGTTTVNYFAGYCNTSVALPADSAMPGYGQINGYATTQAVREVLPLPSRRLSLNATTTIHLVAQSLFAVSTNFACGTISARRVR